MNKIVICIPTYRRPLLLEELLASISKCDVNRSLVKELVIIVVDNDTDKSAESLIDELSEKWAAKFSLNYFNYPVKGLANVRNCLLERALFNAPDFIIFVDDDEYVATDWLNKLVAAIVYNQADAAVGPVLSICHQSVPNYIECWFQRPRHTNNGQIYFLTTNNTILRCSSLEKYGIKFDTRFNFSGSEDTFFGIQILKKGAKIFWADQAIVYEVIPQDRATLIWLLKRKYRIKTTFAYTLSLEKQYLGMVKTFIASIVYIFLGLFASLALLFPFKRKCWGPLKIAVGLGGLAGLFNVTYKEYKENST